MRKIDPKRLEVIRWQAKRHREMWPNPLRWTDAAAQREELLAHIDATTPGTVTTVEELDELPLGSVILDATGRSVQVVNHQGRVNFTHSGGYMPAKYIKVPATVLYTPEVGA